MLTLKRVVLGLLTLWPLCYMLLFMILVAAAVRGVEVGLLRSLGPLHLLTIFVTTGLLIFYIAFLVRTDLVSPNVKPLWAAVLLVGNAAAMPIFFYLYFWKQSNASTPPSEGDKSDTDGVTAA